MKAPDVVIPDQVVDGKRTIKLGGTTLDLIYTGRNSLGAVPSRLAVNDSYPIEWLASLKKTLALGWERMIPGPNGRLGTRKDMEEQIAFMTDLASEVKKASDAGKCFDPATKEVRVPKYATLAQYEQNIEWNVHRWCGYYGRGI